MLGVTARSRLTPVLLLGGDLLCFLVFAVLGLRSHEDGITASGILRAALPFQVGWAVFSTLLGLQGQRASSAPRRVFNAWVTAWAAGLAIRSLAFGRAFSPTFALVSFITNAVLLIGWRMVMRRVTGNN